MYYKAFGIMETLAPLHVGASAGEESGNLNLIFRDQFTQTGIVPGSSIRGRFRSDMRQGKPGEEQLWYGHEVVKGQPDGGTTEALVKFEYASLVWLPVFCPGQPVVWISCPRLLKRYKLVTGIQEPVPVAYTADAGLKGRPIAGTTKKMLFFNLGFLEVQHQADLSPWIPMGTDMDKTTLLVVADNDIAMLHDMALYRQSRVALDETEKKAKGGAFFNVEALPEGSVMIFPVALKQKGWKPFGDRMSQDLYFGGLESIGFGHCRVSFVGLE
jgi:CRISPR-associated protein Cmr4